MKKSLVIVVGVFLTVTSVFLYLGTTAFEVYPSLVPFITRASAPLRNLSNDYHDFLLRSSPDPVKSDQIGIVDIDEASLSEYGQWPWPRFLLANLTEKLFALGADVILFDIVFAEPDRTSPQRLVRLFNEHYEANAAVVGLSDELSDFDTLFADQLSKGKTVLGCFVSEKTDGATPSQQQLGLAKGPPYHLYREGGGYDFSHFTEVAQMEIYPLPKLVNEASSVGSIKAHEDTDNIVRRKVLVWENAKGQLIPSLALEAVRQYLNVKQVWVHYDEIGVTKVRLGDKVIPTDRRGRIFINYRQVDDLDRSFPYLSVHDILSGNVAEEEVRGKILFIGTSAAVMKDIKATPLTPNFAGVETHATLVDNILAQDILQEPEGMLACQVILICLVGLFLTFLISRGRPWLSGLITVLVITVAIAMSVQLLDRRNWLFNPTVLCASVVLIYTVLITIRYWQEEAQRRRLRTMFGPMVSDKVMRYMEEHPERVSLEGQDVDVTIFFSDIAGFTAISEDLPADQVRRLLDRYLGSMNEIIQQHDGFVDKFLGDAVMAVWGAPYPVQEHAAYACLAALDQRDAMHELREVLREEFDHDVYIRMGVNSGYVKAGAMGCEARNQYTVIGDAVNQAARFEPLNKQYGTDIIIGSSTYELAKRSVSTRMLDRIIVKGKSEPVLIYDLMGKIGTLSEQDRLFAHHYENGLASHWNQAWDDALDALIQAAEIRPNDASVKILTDRILMFKKTPPPANWHGAHVYMVK